MTATNPTKDEIARALAERTNELEHLKKAHQEQAKQSVKVEHELADTKRKLNEAGDRIVKLVQEQSGLIDERNQLRDALTELKPAEPAHTHPHLLITGLDSRGDAAFCIGERGDWHVSPLTQSLVIGHGLPRMHIPLMQIAGWQLIPAPPTCRWTPEPEPLSHEGCVGDWDDCGLCDVEEGDFVVVGKMECSCGEEMDVTWRTTGALGTCGNCSTMWKGRVAE